jgi:uncharacterized protein YndB with AHSA1/START domain
MSKVTRQVTINAPQEKVWEVLADVGGIYKWNPGVSYSHSTSENDQGEGATRHCDLQNAGGYLEEKVIGWREGEGYTIDVYESSLPIKRNVVEFLVRPEGDGTLVKVTVDYELKYGPVGALIDTLIARRQYQKGFGELLAGLKYHVETGKEVGEGTKLPGSALSAVA